MLLVGVVFAYLVHNGLLSLLRLDKWQRVRKAVVYGFLLCGLSRISCRGRVLFFSSLLLLVLSTVSRIKPITNVWRSSGIVSPRCSSSRRMELCVQTDTSSCLHIPSVPEAIYSDSLRGARAHVCVCVCEHEFTSF